MNSRYLSRRSTLAGAVGIGVALGLPSVCRARSTLTFVASPTFSPFSTGTDDEKIVGIYADVLQSIGSKLGFDVSYLSRPWPRAQKMVETDEADGFITIATADRRAYAYFTERPLFKMNDAVVAYYADSPHRKVIESAKTLDDLSQATIGEYIGSSHQNSFLKDRPNVSWVKNTSTLVKLLGVGRVDLALEPRDVVKYFAKLDGTSDKILFLETQLVDAGVNQFNIALRKSLSGSEELIRKIEETQEFMRASGELDTIMKGYI